MPSTLRLSGEMVSNLEQAATIGQVVECNDHSVSGNFDLRVTLFGPKKYVVSVALAENQTNTFRSKHRGTDAMQHLTYVKPVQLFSLLISRQGDHVCSK